MSSFRSIKFLNDWLQSMDYDVNFLWHNITVSILQTHEYNYFKNVKVVELRINPMNVER